jgi:hypothetical protein
MLRSSLENQLKPWSELEHFTLEYNYLSTINDNIDFYHKDYSKLVNNYREKTNRSVFPLSQEYIAINSDLINNNLSLLRNAIEIGRTLTMVGNNISPILLHYSFHCLMSFLNYSLFYWCPKHAKGHGLFTYIPPDNIPSRITLNITRKRPGVFLRFIDVFTLLGCPTVFSQYIPIAEKNKVEFIENRGLIPKVHGQIQLKDILNFEHRKWKDELKLSDKENIESLFSDKSSNNFLISYSLIFIVSNIARYRPALWNQILLGKNEFDTKIIEKYKLAIRYYASFIKNVDNILTRIKWIHFRIRINGTLQDEPINFI